MKKAYLFLLFTAFCTQASAQKPDNTAAFQGRSFTLALTAPFVHNIALQTHPRLYFPQYYNTETMNNLSLALAYSFIRPTYRINFTLATADGDFGRSKLEYARTYSRGKLLAGVRNTSYYIQSGNLYDDIILPHTQQYSEVTNDAFSALEPTGIFKFVQQLVFVHSYLGFGFHRAPEKIIGLDFNVLAGVSYNIQHANLEFTMKKKNSNLAWWQLYDINPRPRPYFELELETSLRVASWGTRNLRLYLAAEYRVFGHEINYVYQQMYNYTNPQYVYNYTTRTRFADLSVTTGLRITKTQNPN